LGFDGYFFLVMCFSISPSTIPYAFAIFPFNGFVNDFQQCCGDIPKPCPYNVVDVV